MMTNGQLEELLRGKFGWLIGVGVNLGFIAVVLIFGYLTQ